MAGPDDIAPVPHPGPRPSAFVFPFAEAAAAASALRGMIEEVQSVIDLHETEVDAATVIFSGDSAEAFIANFTDDMADLRTLKGDLDDELTELEQTITTAEGRRDAARAAIDQWEIDSQAYDDYRQEQAA